MKKQSFKPKILTLALAWALSLPGLVWAKDTAVQEEDLTDLPLEQLVTTNMISASKLARQVSDSPSAVAIVTKEDIRDFGYRTLADALGSMRGL